MHVKKTDSYGEDGDFARKVAVIEEFDHWLPEILELTPDVLVVTGDHSTPAVMKGHSWHPNPVLLKSAFQRRLPSPARPWTPSPAVRRRPGLRQGQRGRGRAKFSETACARGILGNFNAMDILPLMMANALKFKKYGA